MNVWKTAILAVIQALGGAAANQQIYEALESGRFIKVSPENLSETKWDKRPAYQNQVRSYLCSLRKNGDLKRELKGYYELTPQGRERIQSCTNVIAPKRRFVPPPTTPENSERRRYQRFKVASETLALSPKGTGRIIEISAGGFSADFYASGFRCGSEWDTNIMGSGGSIIVKIPIKISHVTEKDRFAHMTTSMQKIGFQFRDSELTDNIRSQLKYFIKFHTDQLTTVS